MPASSRKPCDAANPRRRAKSCALRCGRGLAATHKRRPSVRPAGGPMKSSAPTQGTVALHDRHPPAMPAPRFRRPFALHCRAGVHARRGALRRPGRVLARQGAAPLSRLTPTAPLTGEPSGWRSPQSLPCKGRWMRRKAQTEGCTAALPHRYPAKPGRALPCVSWGTMLASSRKPCDAANPKRRAKSPALHCGRGLAATHKRQPFARPTNGPTQASSRNSLQHRPQTAAARQMQQRADALHRPAACAEVCDNRESVTARKERLFSGTRQRRRACRAFTPRPGTRRSRRAWSGCRFPAWQGRRAGTAPPLRYGGRDR